MCACIAEQWAWVRARGLWELGQRKLCFSRCMALLRGMGLRSCRCTCDNTWAPHADSNQIVKEMRHADCGLLHDYVSADLVLSGQLLSLATQQCGRDLACMSPTIPSVGACWPQVCRNSYSGYRGETSFWGGGAQLFCGGSCTCFWSRGCDKQCGRRCAEQTDVCWHLVEKAGRQESRKEGEGLQEGRARKARRAGGKGILARQGRTDKGGQGRTGEDMEV